MRGPVLLFELPHAAAPLFLNAFGPLLRGAVSLHSDGLLAGKAADDELGVGAARKPFFPRIGPLGGGEFGPDKHESFRGSHLSERDGAGDAIRTRDIFLGKEVLYH